MAKITSIQSFPHEKIYHLIEFIPILQIVQDIQFLLQL